ncbi:RNA-binding protein [Mucilaginibacter robiniae]|uniref:RNA-binding protein n=1 Tax=Mucilaginibacter robiniae TaxID=2728022 RepID=A0A7L5EBC2_9SPHI|nr:RNA-binding protein [Mucilaginibacter robiniae]QJD98243.1 RNA-binding protein [Mucilaginibacter robiniae]
MVKLFVSGFPLESTELELAQMIAPSGDISTIKIVRDKKTRICKGYAFVEMLTDEGAVKASAALDGLELEGRELTVKINVDQPVNPAITSRFRPRTGSYSRNMQQSPTNPVRAKRLRRPLQ